MNQLALAPAADDAVDLCAFFERLHECRDKNSLTHGLHPYPAKFIPHIPRALLQAYASPGAKLWDPMCGSGTALVEGSVAGMPSFGTDLNPIAVLAATAKTTRLTAEAREELRSMARKLAGRKLPRRVDLPTFHNRDKWFSDQVAQELSDSKTLIEEELQASARVIALCALSAIIVQVSNQESETRWCAKPRDAIPGEVYRRLAARIADAVERVADYTALDPAPVDTAQSDARSSGLKSDSVDIVVTSPPYANAHDYYLYNKLRMFWLGFDVRSVELAEIGSRHRHSDLKQDMEVYLDEMEAIYREIARVLRPAGTACVVVADAVIRGEFFDIGTLLGARAEAVGLTEREHFTFDHRPFNAAFQRGFGTARSKRTHVLVHAASAGANSGAARSPN